MSSLKGSLTLLASAAVINRPKWCVTRCIHAPTYAQTIYAPTYAQTIYAPTYAPTIYAPTYAQTIYRCSDLCTNDLCTNDLSVHKSFGQRICFCEIAWHPCI